MTQPVDSPPSNRFTPMIGRSKAFRRIERLLRRIAEYDTAVLIEGETGTGKELAARSIHYHSARQGMPFVPVNCGAIPESLIESELFGHRRGAFTGATDTRVGLIAHAQGGTLFLDEVDALSPRAQVTLLRFMQNQEYRPLGCAQTETGNVRVISASNSNLAKVAESGGFRGDLLFRLKILTVEMPPLRARHGDVEMLADYYLRRFSEQYGLPPKTLHADARAWMNGYEWPGNVRELEHFIHREYVLSDGPTITLERETPDVERRRRPDRRSVNLEAGFCEAKAQAVAELERRYLQQVLSLADGNVSRAARLAGKERRALGKLIKKHGLDKHADSGDSPRTFPRQG